MVTNQKEDDCFLKEASGCGGRGRGRDARYVTRVNKFIGGFRVRARKYKN